MDSTEFTEDQDIDQNELLAIQYLAVLSNNVMEGKFTSDECFSIIQFVSTVLSKDYFSSTEANDFTKGCAPVTKDWSSTLQSLVDDVDVDDMDKPLESDELSLKQELMIQFPNLTEDDFGVHGYRIPDLYVKYSKDIWDYLKAKPVIGKNISTFIGINHWDGIRFIDVPFQG